MDPYFGPGFYPYFEQHPPVLIDIGAGGGTAAVAAGTALFMGGRD